MKRLIFVLSIGLLVYSTTIQRDTLANGMIVLTVEAHKIPMIEMKASFYAGSIFDPKGKEGLANLVSKMLVRGTGRRTSYQIADEIEHVGGELAPFANEDCAGLTGKILSKDLGLLIDLLADCLTNPRFDPRELECLKREVISEITVNRDDPFKLSDREFRRLVFGDHPLGHFPEGRVSSIDRISTVEVRGLYDAYYAPNNAFLVFVGDFDKDSLLAMLDEHFQNWRPKTLPALEWGLPPVNTGPVGRIIPMDISQAYILLGNLGPKYGDDGWYEARVMNFILGGSGLTSRLSGKIREEKGLAYIAYSYFQRFKVGGYFTVEVQTRKEMARDVVKIIVDEMARIRDGVDAKELERAKKFFTGYFPLTYDNYQGMARMVTQIEVEQLGLDYPTQFERLIRDVDPEAVRRAAEKYLYPDRFCLLVVGDVKPEDLMIEGITWQ